MELLSPERFHKAESQDRIKYSLIYLTCRLLHLLAYSTVGIWVLGYNYFPLCCCFLGTVFQAVALRRACRWECIGTPHCPSWLCSPNLPMAIALVMDIALLAVTRLDVQSAIVENIHGMDPMFQPRAAFVCEEDSTTIGLCKRAVLYQSNSVTQISQFIVFYFMLFVLKTSRSSLLAGGLCVVIYSAIIQAVSSIYLGSFMFHSDLMFFTVAYGIGVLTKYKMVKAKCTLADVLEKQKEKVVEERVLRCQAEFTYEQVVSQAAPNQVGCDTYGFGDAARANAEGSNITASEVAASAQTAPAFFQERSQDSIPLCPKEGTDCLPATAVTWVENCPAPRSLTALMPGERVLCYDNIGRALTYARVVECHPAKCSATAPWINVTLRDGTQLQMTADHPVAVQPSLEHIPSKQQVMLEMSRRCVHADELTAEQDCLMVLKLVPIPVASVAKVAPDPEEAVEGLRNCTPENQWVTVTVEQPERHELFVANRNRFGEPGQALAVGSSNRLPSSASISVKNTFFHKIEEDARMPKRSSSAPPSVRVGQNVKKSCAESDRTSTASLTTNSISTESSGVLNLADVKIGHMKANSLNIPAAVCLTDFMCAKHAGVSIGSLHNSSDQCSPCSFHYTWLRNPAKFRKCKMSHMCEHCHDISHQGGWRSKFRKRRRPQTTRAVEQEQVVNVV